MTFITGVRSLSRHSEAPKPISRRSTQPKTYTRYKAIMAQVKKYEGPDRYARLAVTLSELTFQTLRIIEKLSTVAIVRLEKKNGLELVRGGGGGGHSRLEAGLQKWIPGDFNLFLSCATELAWVIDNMNCLGADNISLSCDTMNGFFVGPKSAWKLVDCLLTCVCYTTTETELGQNLRHQLLSEATAMRFERRERLVGQLKRSRSSLSEAATVLDNLGEGVHHLRDILPRLSLPSLEQSCREALLLTVAARKGMAIIGERQLVDLAKLLHRESASSSETILICPGIVPRRLWDCLLPYVAVDKHGRTMRGTVDQADWVVTASYSGVGAGLSRLYGSVVNIDNICTPIGVVREGHRPMVRSFSPSELATLRWLICSSESPLDHTYHQLRELARKGESPSGRGCADEWLSLYDQVWSADPQFAEGHFCNSMSPAVMSLMAAASDTPADFREGLLTRVVATILCEECRLETPDGDCILIGRDDEGNVKISAGELAVGEFLAMIAGRIASHCVSRGTLVKSDVRFNGNGSSHLLSRVVPDIVQSSVEAIIPAFWINLVDMDIPPEPLGESSS